MTPCLLQRAATPSKRVLPTPKRSKLLASAKKSAKKSAKPEDDDQKDAEMEVEEEKENQQDTKMELEEKTPRRTSSAFVGGVRALHEFCNSVNNN